MNVRLSDLTLAGWALAVSTVTLMAAAAFYSGGIWSEVLPAGRYPAIILLAPGLLLSLGFFAIGVKVLDRLGYPVTRGEQA